MGRGDGCAELGALMISKNRIAFVLHLLFASIASCSFAHAQTSGVQNPGFETGNPGAQPPGWFVPQPVTDAGYIVRISDESPKEGKQCAFRAAVRFDAGNGFGKAQLWLRVDRAGGGQGFFENMGDRPITSPTWAFYEIVGKIDADAESINVGMMLVGSGKAWIDAVSLGESTGADASPAPPKALTERGIDNLVAYTKLLGYVRHFHPSDAVEKADWNAFAIAGIPAAEDAKDPADLALKLEAFFRPLAPTVRVFVTGQHPKPPAGLAPPPDASAAQVVTWMNIGFGGGTIPPGQNIYRSKRSFASAPGGVVPSGLPDPKTPFEADLGGGVSCLVPTALFAVNNSALPQTVDPKTIPLPPSIPTGDDRTTRLADVALAWNVYEHFFPYFDVVKTDWDAVLRQSLTSAATDEDKRAFYDTLRRLVASAKDGHGNVSSVAFDGYASPPILADWVEKKLVVIQAAPDMLKPRPGDEILKIDGKAVADLWKREEPMIGGATEQWRRYRGAALLLQGPDGSEVKLDCLTGAGEFYTLTLKRTLGNAVIETRPKPIEELKPGIWYVDLDASRAKMEDYKKAIPDLAKAKGIVFDMRGYPNDVAMDVLQRCSDKPITSAFWNVPRVTKPDHQEMEFVQSRWPMTGPLSPRFTGKIAFITDGRAISYAESVMGIVEYFKLADIVGGPTAGTNGNINPVALPGGYVFIFTGMKVVKHDGTTHHGVGIQPTVPVSRTIEGVTAKLDELLEKAIKTVGG
jgi:C-terminal processing protease CtpA/Prc